MSNISGNRIKTLRIEMGLTQEELGEKLGLQKSAIAKYESGRVENIKRSIIQKMADVLDTTPAYLMGWEDDNNQNEYEIQTIAAHHDGEDWTEEELEEIERFKAFVKSKRGQK